MAGEIRIKHETGARVVIDRDDLSDWQSRGWAVDDGPEPERRPQEIAPDDPAIVIDPTLPASLDSAERAAAMRAHRKITGGRVASLTQAERAAAIKAGLLTE